MATYTKGNAPAHVVEHVIAIEKQLDEWPKNHAVFKREWNLAAWHGLTACARELEVSIPPDGRGGGVHQTAVTNLSSAAYQIYMASLRYGFQSDAATSRMSWGLSTGSLKKVLEEAFAYSLACADFPAWHKGVYAVKYLLPNGVVFASSETARHHSFIAYEKGIRREDQRLAASRSKTLDSDAELTLELEEAYSNLSSKGRYGFREGSLTELHQKLFVRYDSRLQSAFRRSGDISLGAYTMLEFRQFTSALLALCGAREHLCFLWRLRGHEVPNNNLLLVMLRKDWVEKITFLSGVEAYKVDQIVNDLSLGFSEVPNRNLTMYPFIALGKSSDWLAVIPGFVLLSNSEENILRNRMVRNKRFADAASLLKEAEMREDLRKALSSINVMGPFSLSKGMPDVDLIIEDQLNSCVVIAELKWLQTPISIPARSERDEELRKGGRQIAFIRNFLKNNPDYLKKKGKLTRSLSEFKQIFYCVICRDYISDVKSELPLIPYAVLVDRIQIQQQSLGQSLEELSNDSWLPILGEDYRFEEHFHDCNGARIGSDVFLPMYKAQLDLVEAHPA